jgi:conjugation system TraG family ATPase
MIINTEDIFPIHSLDGNCILGMNGDITFAYSITLPEIYSLDMQDFDNLNSELFRFFKMFSDCVIHKQDVFLRENFDSGQLPSKTYLQKATCRKFDGRSFLAHRSFLYITYTSLPSLKRNYLNSSILKTGQLFNKDRIKLETFIKEVERAVSVLNASTYCKLTPLDESGIHEIVFQYLNGFTSGKLTDIEFNPDFRIGGRYFGIYAINSTDNLPENIPTCYRDVRLSSDDFSFYKGYLQPLGLDLECNHVLNQFVYLDGHSVLKKELEKADLNFRKFAKFSPNNLSNSKRITKYLNEVGDNENIQLCRAHVNLMVWDQTKDALDRLDKEIITAFRESETTPYQATYIDHVYYYLCSLPGSAGLLPRTETFDTDILSAAAFFLPVTGYQSDDRGLVFNDRKFNVPVQVDDFFKPYETKQISARNSFLIASTGKGKSVLLNHILRQSVEQDFMVTLVELGASYEKLFYLYPEVSAYIQYKEGEPLGLNPFLIRDKKELTADKIRSLTDFIFILWKRDKKEEDFERVSLYKIIKEFYHTHGHLSFSDFYGFVKESKDLMQQLEIDPKFFDKDEFLHVTSEYATGMFKFLLEDSAQQFSLHNKRFVGFELENIRDNLDILPLMFMCILDVTENVIWQNRMADKRIWFEEAAKLMKYPVMLKAMDYYFQTVRKHNGSVGVVLQSIDQVPDNEIGNAIISNTQIYYILEQDHQIDRLKSRLNLSEHDCNQIRSLQSNLSGEIRYTEFFQKLGSRSNVYRLEIPEEALLAYLSETKDKQPIMDEYYRTGSMEKAITNLIKPKA